ncbi:MAG: XRE family transcriptional regulator [Polyangiaceae bacterium]
MSPEDIKALRQELACTARDLARALEVDQDTVLAWERGELFPTKRLVDRMAALRLRGKDAIVRTANKRRKHAPPDPTQVGLAVVDLAVWTALRKVLLHEELRRKLLELAEEYPDGE